MRSILYTLALMISLTACSSGGGTPEELVGLRIESETPIKAVFLHDGIEAIVIRFDTPVRNEIIQIPERGIWKVGFLSSTDGMTVVFEIRPGRTIQQILIPPDEQPPPPGPDPWVYEVILRASHFVDPPPTFVDPDGRVYQQRLDEWCTELDVCE